MYWYKNIPEIETVIVLIIFVLPACIDVLMLSKRRYKLCLANVRISQNFSSLQVIKNCTFVKSAWQDKSRQFRMAFVKLSQVKTCGCHRCKKKTGRLVLIVLFLGIWKKFESCCHPKTGRLLYYKSACLFRRTRNGLHSGKWLLNHLNFFHFSHKR